MSVTVRAPVWGVQNNSRAVEKRIAMVGVYKSHLVAIGTGVVCPQQGKLRHRTAAGSVTAMVRDGFVQVSVPKRVPCEV